FCWLQLNKIWDAWRFLARAVSLQTILGTCKTKFGQDASGDCDRDGGVGTCVCGYSCPSPHKPHM
ncbi:unnamed protein product, partial [Arabidopsis halleri]